LSKGWPMSGPTMARVCARLGHPCAKTSPRLLRAQATRALPKPARRSPEAATGAPLRTTSQADAARITAEAGPGAGAWRVCLLLVANKCLRIRAPCRVKVA
jgi:hypothetical protein